MTTDRPANRSFGAAAAIAALAIASALLSGAGTVSYTGSDPRGTLLTAQALIEHGTFALDAYPGIPADHRIVELAGRKFYAYPPGTPLLSVPAVAIARLAGFDMARREDDDKVQRVLAAISVGAAAVLASLLALRSLPWPLAVLLAGIFVFGTPVISTMGTAFWSINAMLLATMSALLLLPGESSRSGAARATAAGSCSASDSGAVRPQVRSRLLRSPGSSCELPRRPRMAAALPSPARSGCPQPCLRCRPCWS